MRVKMVSLDFRFGGSFVRTVVGEGFRIGFFKEKICFDYFVILRGGVYFLIEFREE